MSNVQEALISIYDAAIDQSRWQQALDHVMEQVGSSAASLLVVTTETGKRTGAAPFALQVLSGQLARLDPEIVDHYVAHHAVLETDAWQYLRKLPPGTLLTDDVFYPDLQAVRSRPDFDYVINQMGLFRRMTARLNDNRSWYDAIAFQWDKDILDIPPGAVEQANVLIPHVSKALQLSRSNHQLHQRYQAVIGALDQVQVGVCITDQDGYLMVANQEARRILAMQDGIQLTEEQRLVAKNTQRDAQLRRAIDQVALTAAGRAFQPGETLLIDRLSDEHPFLVDVTPIRDSLGELQRNMSGAMVTIIDPGNHQPFQTRRVAIAYGLSEAEVEVCRLVVDGWSNQAIADERSVSLDTVKTQVRSIMNKTATNRRADLIRLVVQTAPPIKLNDPPEEGWAQN